jgi:hypothetical protein
MTVALLSCSAKREIVGDLQRDSSNMSTVNPNTMRFAIPTINDALPEFTAKVDTCAFFHEDDWRQIEFVSKDQREAIGYEFLKIQNVYERSDSTNGFSDVAVRTLITKPLSIKLSTLKSYLTSKKIKMLGLGLENNEGQVKDGFFVEIEGVNYYGIANDGIVSTLGIFSVKGESELRAATKKLAKLLKAEKLYLVDWKYMNLYDEINIESDLLKNVR